MVFMVIGPAKKVSRKKRTLSPKFSIDKPITWTSKEKKAMDKRMKKVLAKIKPLVPENLWCQCRIWREQWDTLANFDQMNFCIYCGKKLNKGGISE